MKTLLLAGEGGFVENCRELFISLFREHEVVFKAAIDLSHCLQSPLVLKMRNQEPHAAQVLQLLVVLVEFFKDVPINTQGSLLTLA